MEISHFIVNGFAFNFKTGSILIFIFDAQLQVSNDLFEINFDLDRLRPFHETNCFDDPEFTWIANIFFAGLNTFFSQHFESMQKKYLIAIANDVGTFDFNSLYLWSMSMNNKLDQYFFWSIFQSRFEFRLLFNTNISKPKFATEKL